MPEARGEVVRKAQPRQQDSKPVATKHGEEAEIEQLGLDRLVFFSDAVYAIAITLLVIDLRLPPGSGELGNVALRNTLQSMLPQFFSYVLSFLVIGSFWSNHHRKFRYVKGYDRRVVFINLLLLMVVAFLPFPTAVLGESGNATATIFYAGTIVIASLLSALVFGLSIPIAQYDANLAKYFWALLVPVSIVVR
jgi:uncharacterized membrane protein